MLSELYIEHDLEIQVRIFALGVPRQAEFDLSTYPAGRGLMDASRPLLVVDKVDLVD
ncbi:MAG: hypothetical protein WAK31_24305 [Chthoniobacterales bacterium]